MRVGVCLSGGGFRASLYGLGVLRYLAESGVLGATEVLSGVSGGSVAAAAAMTAPSSNRFVQEVYKPFVTAVSSQNLRNRAMTRWARSRLGRHGRPRNLVLSDVLAEALYPSLGTLRELPSRPQLVITATDLASGRAFRFSQEFLGNYDWGYAPPPPHLRVATAVAASVAVPIVFPPLQMPTRGLGLSEHVPDRLSITDGGVYDNLGVEWFQGWGSGRPASAVPADFLVVVNASGPLIRSTKPYIGPFAVNRGRQIQYAQTQATRVRWLIASFMAGDLRGTYLGITGDPRKATLPDHSPVAPALYEGALPSRLVRPLAQLRTDLDRFTTDEANLLAYHGYWSAHVRFGSLFPDMAVGRPQWRDYAELSNEDAATLERELLRPRHRLGLGQRVR